MRVQRVQRSHDCVILHISEPVQVLGSQLDVWASNIFFFFFGDGGPAGIHDYHLRKHHYGVTPLTQMCSTRLFHFVQTLPCQTTVTNSHSLQRRLPLGVTSLGEATPTVGNSVPNRKLEVLLPFQLLIY